MDRIEEILRERGLSKAAFAELLGTSRQNVNSLLKNPTRSKLEEIAKALDVPLWQLFVSPDELTGTNPRWEPTEGEVYWYVSIPNSHEFHNAEVLSDKVSNDGECHRLLKRNMFRHETEAIVYCDIIRRIFGYSER